MKLKHDDLLQSFEFKNNLRRYTQPPNSGTLRRCSGCGRTIARGTRRRACTLLRAVTLRSCSGRGSTTARGTARCVGVPLSTRFSNGRWRTAAPQSPTGPYERCRNTHETLCTRNEIMATIKAVTLKMKMLIIVPLDTAFKPERLGTVRSKWRRGLVNDHHVRALGLDARCKRK